MNYIDLCIYIALREIVYPLHARDIYYALYLSYIIPIISIYQYIINIQLMIRTRISYQTFFVHVDSRDSCQVILCPDRARGCHRQVWHHRNQELQRVALRSDQFPDRRWCQVNWGSFCSFLRSRSRVWNAGTFSQILVSVVFDRINSLRSWNIDYTLIWVLSLVFLSFCLCVFYFMSSFFIYGLATITNVNNHHLMFQGSRVSAEHGRPTDAGGFGLGCQQEHCGNLHHQRHEPGSVSQLCSSPPPP